MRNQKSLKYSGTASGPGKFIQIHVDVLEFSEDNVHFIYSPALELTGYGNTLTEAKESFEICLSEFLSYTSNKNTLKGVLKNLGWKVSGSSKKFDCIMPSFSTMIEYNSHLGDIVDTKTFKKVRRSVEIPVMA